MSSILEHAVVLCRFVQKISLCAIGIPNRGSRFPSRVFSSDCCARLIACSGKVEIKLFKLGSCCSIRLRKCRVSSSLEYSPLSRSMLISLIVFECQSVTCFLLHHPRYKIQTRIDFRGNCLILVSQVFFCHLVFSHCLDRI